VENVFSPLSSVYYSAWPPPRCPRERLQLLREGKSGLLFHDEKISRVSSLDSAVVVALITDWFVRSLVSTFPHLARVLLIVVVLLRETVGVIKGNPVRDLPTRSYPRSEGAVGVSQTLVRNEAGKKMATSKTTSGKDAGREAAGFMDRDSDQIRAESEAGKQMVLAVQPEEDLESVEEFDIDPTVEEGAQAPVWFAMARYYSRILNPKGLFDEMGATWRLERPIMVIKLDENKFILEFDTEHHYQYALNGGPWRHKGDALIMVPYDGLVGRQRLRSTLLICG
jgi:hypothetical protein